MALKPLRIFVYEGMGIGFLSFWAVSFFYFLNIFFPNFSSFLGLIALVTIVLFALISFYFGSKVYSKEINISSNKIINNKSFIFISDIHLGSNNKETPS